MVRERTVNNKTRYSDREYSLDVQLRVFSCYLVTEARNVHRKFDNMIYDVAADVRKELMRQADSYTYDDEPIFTGWCYDSQSDTAIEGTKETAHPIYIQYIEDTTSNGIFYIDIRETNNKSKEELEYDPIIITVNIAIANAENARWPLIYDNIEMLLAHELTHARDMWRLPYENPINNFRNVGYTYVNKDYLKERDITVNVPDDVIYWLNIAFNIMSQSEANAKCEEVDKFIKSVKDKDYMSLMKLLSDGDTPEAKANLFIQKYQDQFGYWEYIAKRFMMMFSDMMYKRDDIMLPLLFTQYSIKFGYSDDKTGGYMSTHNATWDYVNNILTGKVKLTRNTLDTITDAYNAFVEIVAKHTTQLVAAVTDSLTEHGLINESQLFESTFPLHMHNYNARCILEFNECCFVSPMVSLAIHSNKPEVSELAKNISKIHMIRPFNRLFILE